MTSTYCATNDEFMDSIESGLEFMAMVEDINWREEVLIPENVEVPTSWEFKEMMECG